MQAHQNSNANTPEGSKMQIRHTTKADSTEWQDKQRRLPMQTRQTANANTPEFQFTHPRMSMQTNQSANASTPEFQCNYARLPKIQICHTANAYSLDGFFANTPDCQ